MGGDVGKGAGESGGGFGQVPIAEGPDEKQAARGVADFIKKL